MGVSVLGRPSLIRDLADHLVGVPASHNGNGKGGADAAALKVAVLVDPESEHWEQADSEGKRVVLLVNKELDDDATAEAVLRGADAILHAGSPPEQIREAIETVAGGGTLLDLRQTRALANLARARRAEPVSSQLHLTSREQDILASIAGGHSVKQTARALRISPKTVENLQGRLYRKLGVRNRAQAVARAHALGVLPEAS